MKKVLLPFLAFWLALSQVASAQLLLLGVGSGGASLSPFSLTFIASGADGVTSTTFTEASQSVGVDATGIDHRWTIVGAASNSGATRTVSSMTICGVAATSVIASALNTGPSALFIADTTGKGTTCTIAITMSASSVSAGWGIFRMINPGSSTPDATNSGSWAAASTAMTLSLNISAGGSAVGVASCKSATDRTFTWVGLTEDYDAVQLTGSASHTGSHGGSSGTPTTVTVTPSSTCTGTGESASWH